MHNGHPEWKKQPNYSLLVDTRDREQPQMTYVPEENMEVIRGTKVLHPKVDDYFETYDGGQYLPRPWLRTLYPFDWWKDKFLKIFSFEFLNPTIA